MCTHPFELINELGLYRVATDGVFTEEHIITMAEALVAKRFSRGNCLAAPEQTRRYITLKVASLEHEVFGVIFLDNRHCVLACEELFRGTIDGASVYPREVVKRVLHYNSAAVIFYHNHPSGTPEPSVADQRITSRLIKALELIDVRVLDHFVVGGMDAISFAERGLL